MKSLVYLSRVICCFGAVALLTGSFLVAGEGTKKILYFERSAGFVHPPTIAEEDGISPCSKALTKMGKEAGFEVVTTKDGSVFDGDLEQFDAFVFYTCADLDGPGGPDDSPYISQEGKKKFFEAIENGKGFLGFHSATDTWRSPGPDWENQPVDQRTEYTKMIGAQFIVHGAQQDAVITVVDNTLPWTAEQGKSFKFWDEWYALKNFNEDMHVILVQETKGMNHVGHDVCYDRPAYPCTWARMQGKGRVAYTSFGHNADAWSEPVVYGLVKDLVGFVLGDYDLDLTPNLKDVCPGASIIKNPKK